MENKWRDNKWSKPKLFDITVKQWSINVPKKKTMINQIFDHFNKPSYNLNDFLNLINLEFIAFCGKF
jgi:hypothetical protein